MGRYDLDFEDDGASWNVRRERQLRDMVLAAHREKTRPVRLLRVMLIPPLICGAIFLIMVLIAIGTAIAGAAEPIDFSKPLFVGKNMPACMTQDDVKTIYQSALAGKTIIPRNCTAAEREVPVVVLENTMSGLRVRATDGSDEEVWVPTFSLRN